MASAFSHPLVRKSQGSALTLHSHGCLLWMQNNSYNNKLHQTPLGPKAKPQNNQNPNCASVSITKVPPPADQAPWWTKSLGYSGYQEMYIFLSLTSLSLSFSLHILAADIISSSICLESFMNKEITSGVNPQWVSNRSANQSSLALQFYFSKTFHAGLYIRLYLWAGTVER